MWPIWISIFLLSALLMAVNSASIYTNKTSFLYNHPWIPAALVPNASRSPCPMLNTLANHGFLPRNGLNITTADLTTAQIAALNFDYALASGTTNAMVAKLGIPENVSAALSLSDFSSHNHTEHDASVTRLDILQGSNADVNPALVKLFLDDSPTTYITARTIGLTRVRREYESRAIGSPRLSEAFTAFARLESSFIPLVFGVAASADADGRRAPKAQLMQWLNEERFPVEGGFDRPKEVLTKELQMELIARIKQSYELYLDATEVLFPSWGAV